MSAHEHEEAAAMPAGAQVASGEPVSGEPVSGLRLFLGHRTWWWWALATTLARLPGNMAPLGLILVLPKGRGAIVASAYTVGIALGAGWRGRAIDRTGYRKGLRREALLLASSFAALAAAIAARAPMALLGLLAFAAGVSGSAVGMGYRAALPSFLPERVLPSAYSLDAALNEASFIVSPLLTAVLVAFAPPFGVSAAGAMLAVGSALAGSALPRDGHLRPPTPASTRSWLSTALPIYLITAGVGITFGLVLAGLPERLADLGWQRATAGVLFGIMSGSSMVVGVVVAARGGFGAHRRGIGATLLGVLAFSFAALLVVPHPAFAVAAMALFGVPVAPLNALGTQELSDRAPDSSHAQAFALLAAVVTAGSGTGLALAAVLFGLVGVAGVLATGAAVCALLGAILVVPLRAIGRRR